MKTFPLLLRKTYNCVQFPNIATLAALLCLLPQGAFAELPEVPFGMDRSFDFYSEASEMGARWQRARIFWKHVEESNDSFRWNMVDGMVGSLEEHDLVPVLLIRTGELDWATQPNLYGADYGNGSFLPLDLSEEWNEQYGHSETYYDFVYHLVDRVCGRVPIIVIENEGNSPKFFYGEWQDYLRLVKTASKAAHDACPNVIVTDSGIASALWGWCIVDDMIESGTFTDEEIKTFATGYYRRCNENGSHDFMGDDGMQKIQYRLAQNAREITFADSLFSNVEGVLDALNFHFYEDYEYIDDVIRWLDAKTQARGFTIPQKVSNEMGIRNRDEEYDRESLEHAYDVMKKLLHVLRTPVKLFCWFPMSDGWNSGDEYRITTDKIGLGDGYPKSDGGSYLPRYASFAYAFVATLFQESPRFVREDRSVPDIVRWEYETMTAGVTQSVVALWWDDGLGGEGSSHYILDVPFTVPEVVVMQFPDVEIHIDPAEVEGRISLEVGMNPLFILYPRGTTGVGDGGGSGLVPRAVSLFQNYPNPFNPQTVIPYEIEGAAGESRQVELAVYNLRGVKVRSLLSRSLRPGSYTAAWDGRSDEGVALPSGIYLYRLVAGKETIARKMLLAR